MTKHRLFSGLLVLVALGTYPALAQTPGKPTATKLGITRPGQSDIVVSAANSVSNGGVTTLSGNVSIAVGDIRIFADEAQVAGAMDEIKLKGNVSLRIR